MLRSGVKEMDDFYLQDACDWLLKPFDPLITQLPQAPPPPPQALVCRIHGIVRDGIHYHSWYIGLGYFHHAFHFRFGLAGCDARISITVLEGQLVNLDPGVRLLVAFHGLVEVSFLRIQNPGMALLLPVVDLEAVVKLEDLPWEGSKRL